MPVASINGRNVNVSARYGSHEECAFCGVDFQITSTTGRQFYCSESCKEKAFWLKERQNPAIVASNRARCRAWAVTARGVTRSQPWLLGAPPCAPYLPGGAFALAISPAPQWAIELRNTRALHGLVTTMIGKPHDSNRPGFALVPSGSAPSGWGVYVPDPEDALRLSNRSMPGVLFDRPVEARCGNMFRLKAPVVTKRGRRRLRVDCITPVVIRSSGGTIRHTVPCGSNLLSTLATWTPHRLGIAIGDSDAVMQLIERHTQPQWTPLGGKYGATGGFVGHVIVECNAVSEWLLRCCESIGFGGKTAFGFGRIRVSGA